MNKQKIGLIIGILLLIVAGFFWYFTKTQNLYYRYNNNGEEISYDGNILNNCTSSDFKIIYDTPSATSAYGICNNQIYIGENIITGADIGSFSVIFFNKGQQADDYSKDKNYVYKYNTIIKDADPVSFNYLGSNFSKDNKHVFYAGELISGANPISFEIFSLTDGFAKDSNHIYRCTQMLSGEIPSTFETIDFFGHGQYRYYSKDCNTLITGDNSLSKDEFYKIAMDNK